MKSEVSILAKTLLLAAIPAGLNAFIDVNLPGITDYDEWDNVSATNPQIAGSSGAFGSFPGATPWPTGIDSVLTFGTATAADDDPTGNASFGKVSGQGYPAGFSIYGAPSFGPGTHTPATHNVYDSDLVAGLETIVFQIRIGSGSAGWIDGDPVLTVNGGDAIANDTDYFFVRALGDFDSGFGEVATNEYTFMWDLRSYTDPITEYDIRWTMDGSSTTITALELNSGDTFSPTAVPEPSIFAFFAGIGAFFLVCSRRRRRAL